MLYWEEDQCTGTPYHVTICFFLLLYNTIFLKKFIDDPVLLQLRMIKCLHVIHIDQLETQRRLTDVEVMIPSLNSNGNHSQSFAEKYNLCLPLPTIDDFLTMDSLLKNNLSFKAEFVSKKCLKFS